MRKTKKTKNKKKNVNVTCEVVTAVKSFCAEEGKKNKNDKRKKGTKISKSRALDEILKDAQMQSKVEVLFDVETFVNIKEILGSVQKLINSGKFSSLGDSNVVQFKKEFRDINFGFWGNIVSGRRKQDKAANVKVLKNQFLKLFHTSKLLDVESICWDEVEMTALCTDSENLQKQDPHTDYSLVDTNDPTKLAWTAHLPLNLEEGSYIYIWGGQGCGTAIHIAGGQCLLLRSDVIHSGGVPEGCDVGNTFVRLHFYLPTKHQKPPPLGESIYRTGSNGAYFSIDHWHTEPQYSAERKDDDFPAEKTAKERRLEDDEVPAEERRLKEKRLAALKCKFDKDFFLLKRNY